MFSAQLRRVAARHVAGSGWRRRGPAFFSSVHGRDSPTSTCVSESTWPTRSRLFSTSSIPELPPPNSKGNGGIGSASNLLMNFAVATLGVLSGTAIYWQFLAPAPHSTPSNSSSTSPTPQTADDNTDACLYASPEETRQAIAELRAIFTSQSSSSTANENSGTDKVSTDPDDLHNHGFSANDHYPGTCAIKIAAICRVAYH